MTASEHESEPGTTPATPANGAEATRVSSKRNKKKRASPEAVPSDAEAAAVEVPETPDNGDAVLAVEIDESLEVLTIDEGAPADGAEIEIEVEVEPDEEEAGPKLTDREVEIAIEAMLFASSEPLTPGRMAQALGLTQRRVRSAVERLREEYAATGRAFDVREIAGGFKLYTRPEHEGIVARLEKVRPPEKLSASALETLAIVAYRQPITRAELDSIRGVQCGAILKSLTERKLIRATGRSELPGRPIQYGTSKRFLDHFGLASLEDLPRVEDLKAP